jgi:hypothetical protein
MLTEISHDFSQFNQEIMGPTFNYYAGSIYGVYEMLWRLASLFRNYFLKLNSATYLCVMETRCRFCKVGRNC